METYDVLVLGGGTAGSRAAATAAAAGARTAMFNDGELGGLCILRGCMPTKTLLHGAGLVHEAAHHRTPGIGHAELTVDFAAVMANKDAKVARFQRAKVASIEAGGYDVIRARARFAGPDTVVADGRTYRFRRGAVLATGSAPRIPDLPGLDSVPFLTSDDVLRLREQPASMMVVGSGAVGLEMAQLLARLGTDVTLVSRRPLLASLDQELGAELEAALRAEPRLELLSPCQPRRARRRGDSGLVELEVEVDGGTRAVAAETLLLATGRHPALENLGLEEAGIQTSGGTVVAGPDLATSNPRVFVAGDARGAHLLLHLANQEGRVAGLAAAQVPGDHRVDDRLHMEVIFTDPAVATVGLTEQGARGRGIQPLVARARLPETGRAITQDIAFGIWKLLAAPSGELLGSQILAPRADDLIHTIATVMFYRGTAADLLEMPWYHPTLSEVALDLARQLTRLTPAASGRD